MRLLFLFARLRWRLLMGGLRGARKRDRLERASRTFAIVVPALLVVLGLGLAIGVGTLAFVAARKVGTGEWGSRGMLLGARLFLIGLLSMLVLIPVGGGQSAFSGHPRVLLLPIPRRVLFAVEALSSLADPWTLFAIPALACVAAGFASAGRLGAALVAGAAGLAMTLALAAIGALCAFVVAWLMRDRRRGEVFTLIAVLAITCISVVPALYGERIEVGFRDEAALEGPSTQPVVESVDEGLPAWSVLVPSELYARAVGSGLAGDARTAWLTVLGLLAQALVLGALASRVHGRLLEVSSGGSKKRRGVTEARASPRIPGLSPAATAVAWTQARTAIRSVRGRVVVLMPGPLVLIFGVLAQKIPDELPAGTTFQASGPMLLGAGLLFSLYALLAFLANQFASDRAGLTLQFLAPISNVDIVRGKAVGIGFVFAVTLVACTLCAIAVSPGGSPLAWFAVVCGGVATYALVCPLGVVLSAYLPVAADLSKTGSGGNPHGFAFFVGTIGVLAASAPAALIVQLLAPHYPEIAALLAVLWLALAVALAAVLVGPVSRAVAERRENLALVAQSR